MVSAEALLAAVLAGVAILLVSPDPVARLGRTPPPTVPAAASTRFGWLAAGRPSALSWRRRAGWSCLASTAVCLALSQSVDSLGPWLWSLWPLLTGLGTVGLGWLEPRSVRERSLRLVLETPQALELMAACLAVGTPPRSACAQVADVFDGPVADDLKQVVRAVELGVSDQRAWLTLAQHPQLGPAALDLARSVESGTQMVEALRTHAATARERRRAALQQAARSVGVRSVLPLMTCFLPAFLLLGVVPTVVSAVLQAFR